jgi:hypothetical protein
MSNVSLKIRHAKRAGETTLNLSNEDLLEVPTDISTLTDLKSLDISHNKISSLDGLHSLPCLVSLDASFNKIIKLNKSILACKSLTYLSLKNNPIIASYPELALLKNGDLQNGLCKYFDTIEAEEQYAEDEEKEGIDSIHDEKELKKIIKTLKDKETKKAEPIIEAMSKSSMAFHSSKFEKKDDDASNEAYIKKIKDLEIAVSKLKSEQLKATSLTKLEINAGSLGGIAGVIEIPFEELDIKEQINGGGFSVIHKGFWRGSRVAIKKIFDPNLTKELMDEIYNEVLIMSILRHPKICLLLGVCSQKSNLAIIMELAKYSLYEVIHKSPIVLSNAQKLRIAKDVANAYTFMHKSGIVHRDLKSHNILFTEGMDVKICDFGLAKYKV